MRAAYLGRLKVIVASSITYQQYRPDGGNYFPHQGKRECARRQKQIEAGRIRC